MVLFVEQTRYFINRPLRILYPDTPLSGSGPGMWREDWPEDFELCAP